MNLKDAIRTIPDHPKAGIMFRDITTLLGDARAFRRAVDELLATGCTALAAIALLRQARADLIGAAFVVDLPELGGADRIRAAGVQVSTLVEFDGG